MFNIKTVAELVAERPEFTNVTWLARIPAGDLTRHARAGDAVLLHEQLHEELTGTTLLVLVLRRVEPSTSETKT